MSPVPVSEIIASAGENVALEVGKEYMVANGAASLKVCTTGAQEFHMRAKEDFTTEWRGFQSKVSDLTDWKSVDEFVKLLMLEKFETEAEFETAFRKIRKILKFVPTKANIISSYSRLVATGQVEKSRESSIEKVVLKKGIRSNSGVVVITVVTAPGPFSCPQDCAYCPNEPGQPRSYLSTEPAVARANQNKFDPVRQVYDRAATLARQGHKIDKLEIIVLGGTWSGYPWEYQQQFCRDIFFAANTFNEDLARSRLDQEVYGEEDAAGEDMPCVALQLSDRFNSLLREKRTLQEEQLLNESAECKVIGLTLETRPDHISPLELKRLRSLGCTRVQIGVQHTDDEILKKINRGCTTADAVRAVALLKQHCFKVDIHLMPDLPFSSVEADIEMFDFVLDTEHLQADHWKIYPCEVTPFSAIEDWFAQGAYKPYTDVDPENLVNLLVHVKAKVHPWIRLNRVIRDIPVESIIAGNMNTNLRQEVYRRLAQIGEACRCIRCREVRDWKPNEEVVMRRRNYRSSQGDEIFLTFEGLGSRGLGGGAEHRGIDKSKLKKKKKLTKKERKMSQGSSLVSAVPEDNVEEYDEQNAPLYALLRLRFNDDPHSPAAVFPELDNCALIRELHVYGVVAPSRKITETAQDKVQHSGFGRRLMKEAERIARERGYNKIAVIAGIGVRNYYRKLGYELQGLFMVKKIDEEPITSEVVPFSGKSVPDVKPCMTVSSGIPTQTLMLGGIACLALVAAVSFLFRKSKV